ncbi:Lsr2 family protein [Streptomyces fagopyri]|uniref:histone-like nucleoid-structuring protein Lsr2 n=1 Tax=Streptomyces fagopyri TaxID=2662397 RepID=UPI00367956BB
MAQKTITVYTDDLTGKEHPEISTHEFSLNGVKYEIDLSPDSYDELADALARFIQAGRKTGRTRVSKGRKADADGPSAVEMRTWARSNGFEVNDRGRVPANIRVAYEQAN